MSSSEYVHLMIERELAERMSAGEVYAVRIEWVNEFEAVLNVTADPEVATDPERS